MRKPNSCVHTGPCGPFNLSPYSHPQVTRGVDAPSNVISTQEKDTIDAIVLASNCALSIVMVGVGDGPFDQMRHFDDHLHRAGRTFDNFQFVQVDTTAAGRAAIATPAGEARFALNALMEIPEQYGAIVELGLLGCTGARARREGWAGRRDQRRDCPPLFHVLCLVRSRPNGGRLKDS